MPRTRTKSEFVSSAGTVFELVKKLSDQVYSLGGSDDDLRRIINEDSIALQIAKLLVVWPRIRSFELSVDYSRLLREVVTAGIYHVVNDHITEENFPTDRGDPEVVGNPTETQALLVHFGRPIENDDVLTELKRLGLRPGTMFELAHLGEQHRYIQCKFPVVAAGSSWESPRSGRTVGYLWGNVGIRNLLLACSDGTWEAHYRFLAFRK